MTTEKKLEALYSAVNNAWDDAFDGWEWSESENNPNVFILGENTIDNGYTFFLSGCEDIYGGWIWIEYEPEKDIVGIYVKDRPIQPKFKEDLKNLFEKYSPFNMKVRFERNTTPILYRKEVVELKGLTKYFKEFKKAYSANYPLFYMFTVSAKEWYDEFRICGADC